MSGSATIMYSEIDSGMSVVRKGFTSRLPIKVTKEKLKIRLQNVEFSLQSDQVKAEGHDDKAVPGILDCGVCSARASTRHLTMETALTL